ncbi:MAG: class I SAM-dependent methyltransferase [Verrucomicrobia bacterium]|nr:class I SAM-dependent methyltransferase [Verrucomicrobiota bacterium]
MQPLLLHADWPQYRLLDSGNGLKLEAFGDNVLVRSEPKAWWQPHHPPAFWQKADASFEEKGRDGIWRVHNPRLTRNWNMSYGPVTAQIRLTDMSKHVGVFPEQDPHWQWMSARLARRPGARFLNLFGYTGMASLTAAAAGAMVTHVDASKPALAWAKMNQQLSGLESAPVRWLLDDAFKFVERELRRGNQYDAIALDPPSFGRGPKGEIWKVEQQISGLLSNLRRLLSPKPLFVVMTLYNLEASSVMLHNLFQQHFPAGELSFGELVLRPHEGGHFLPLSLFSRWQAA